MVQIAWGFAAIAVGIWMAAWSQQLRVKRVLFLAVPPVHTVLQCSPFSPTLAEWYDIVSDTYNAHTNP